MINCTIFVAAGVRDAAPLEKELLVQADKLVGGSDAVLVIDDTAVPKKGKHSVGVASQYASVLGKNANCQTLVSLTLARDEVPVMVALRLFLPESWTRDLARLQRAGVSNIEPHVDIFNVRHKVAFGRIEADLTCMSMSVDQVCPYSLTAGSRDLWSDYCN